jgi:hypothetical protein
LDAPERDVRYNGEREADAGLPIAQATDDVLPVREAVVDAIVGLPQSICPLWVENCRLGCS